jgi:hypothetical protein
MKKNVPGRMTGELPENRHGNKTDPAAENAIPVNITSLARRSRDLND